MDEIPIEFDGYELIVCDPLETVYHFQEITEFKGSILEIQYGFRDENKKSYDYLVKYKDKSLYIDDEFMRKRSETYVKVSHIWCDFKTGYDDTYFKSEILGVYPFDGHLFIVTDGIKVRLQRNCQDCIPITLYVLDLESEKVYYAGYYRNYLKPDVPVSIIKKGEISNEK